MINSEIAIAIVTFYPKWHRGKLRSLKETDKIRGDLALEFIKKASKLAYQIVVAENRSPKTFQHELSKIKNVTVIRRRAKKRSPAKRQAIKKASQLPGVKVIILAEAEKISLIDSIEHISQPILIGRIDIVVPKRENALFKSTYPDYMYRSEEKGNKEYNQLLKKYKVLGENEPNLDMFFGPRAFANKLEITSFFMKNFSLKKRFIIQKDHFDSEDYSNTLFFPVIMALKKNKRVKSVTVPFKYPKLQKENEEKGMRVDFIQKRINQRIHLLSELKRFLKKQYKRT